MDEVKEYETRHTSINAPDPDDIYNDCTQCDEQDEVEILDTESQLQPAGSSSPIPKTPDQYRLAAQSSLAIRPLTRQRDILLHQESIPDSGPDGDMGPSESTEHLESSDDDADKTVHIFTPPAQDHSTDNGGSPQGTRWLSMSPQRASPA